MAAPTTPLPDLPARVARLLDRSQPRLAEELDLAEAICAVKWPNWPEYRGPVDLGLLRLALKEFRIDAATLHWLDSHELARACREAGANEGKYQLVHRARNHRLRVMPANPKFRSSPTRPGAGP